MVFWQFQGSVSNGYMFLLFFSPGTKPKQNRARLLYNEKQFAYSPQHFH